MSIVAYGYALEGPTGVGTPTLINTIDVELASIEISVEIVDAEIAVEVT